VKWRQGLELDATLPPLMGKEARREYESKYTAERNYHLLMDVYQHAIAENHSYRRS